MTGTAPPAQNDSRLTGRLATRVVEEASMSAKHLHWRPVLFVVLALAIAPPVSAHAELERSEPQAGATLAETPPDVQLWFDDEPDVTVSRIDMTGPSGKVEMGPVKAMQDKSIISMIPGKLAPGAYKVDWQTAGDDGHISKGTYSFMVHGQ
jgi:methionine-rich copper-binding protein CopC